MLFCRSLIRGRSSTKCIPVGFSQSRSGWRSPWSVRSLRNQYDRRMLDTWVRCILLVYRVPRRLTVARTDGDENVLWKSQTKISYRKNCVFKTVIDCSENSVIDRSTRKNVHYCHIPVFNRRPSQNDQNNFPYLFPDNSLVDPARFRVFPITSIRGFSDYPGISVHLYFTNIVVIYSLDRRPNRLSTLSVN